MTTLLATSIDWAIEHLARHCDTDLFPRAFEYGALLYHKGDVVQVLSKQDICQRQTRPFRQCLVPKQRYGFRIASQLDPLDMVFYLALCLEVGEQIENARLPTKEKASFSYRFAPDESDYTLFDSNVGYTEFQNHSRKLASQYGFVVLADIADFYPRIYFHRLENALNSAIRSQAHARALLQLVKGWNQNISIGIPIGSDPSRLLADLVIDDVDRALLAEGMVFCRFVDDYRIFCHSKEEAYQRLGRLAIILYDTHRLTLQTQKTKIMSSSEFIAGVLESEERRELSALADNFREIAVALGLANPYQPVDYDQLKPRMKEQIDRLNLEALLQKQLDAPDIDIPMTRFLINRLGQIKRTAPVNLLVKKTEKLYPVFAEVIRYLDQLADNIERDTRTRIGKYLLDLLEDSVVSQLEFHRMQIIRLFAETSKWSNAEKLVGYYSRIGDSWSRRKLLLAIGKADQGYWLRTKKPEMEQMCPWERRAFVYAASCLPHDERKHYYRAIFGRLDDLEKWVIRWAEKQPINT